MNLGTLGSSFRKPRKKKREASFGSKGMFSTKRLCNWEMIFLLCVCLSAESPQKWNPSFQVTSCYFRLSRPLLCKFIAFSKLRPPPVSYVIFMLFLADISATLEIWTRRENSVCDVTIRVWNLYSLTGTFSNTLALEKSDLIGQYFGNIVEKGWKIQFP